MAVAPGDREKLCEERGFEVIWDKLGQRDSATAATLCQPERREEPVSTTDYYSEAAHGPHEIFELGNYQLESGITLPNARIAYKTHGTLNAAKDNVVLFPHM